MPSNAVPSGGLTVIEGRANLAFARILALKGALHLEMLGYRRSGKRRSAYALCKEAFDPPLKGSRESVYEQVKAYTDYVLGYPPADD